MFQFRTCGPKNFRPPVTSETAETTIPAQVAVPIINNVPTVCTVTQMQRFTVSGNQDSYFNTSFSSCPSCLNASSTNDGTTYSICAIEYLYIIAQSSGKIILAPSSSCPAIADITATYATQITNVCSTEELYINADGSSTVTVWPSPNCSKIVNITTQSDVKVYNVCAKDELTVLSATGNSQIKMYFTQLSSCPRYVNILYGGANSIFYVCAQDTIYANLSGSANLYYKGTLNYTNKFHGGSVYPWT